jgi:hypothetical protein
LRRGQLRSCSLNLTELAGSSMLCRQRRPSSSSSSRALWSRTLNIRRGCQNSSSSSSSHKSTASLLQRLMMAHRPWKKARQQQNQLLLLLLLPPVASGSQLRSPYPACQHRLLTS